MFINPHFLLFSDCLQSVYWIFVFLLKFNSTVLLLNIFSSFSSFQPSECIFTGNALSVVNLVSKVNPNIIIKIF